MEHSGAQPQLVCTWPQLYRSDPNILGRVAGIYLRHLMRLLRAWRSHTLHKLVVDRQTPLVLAGGYERDLPPRCDENDRGDFGRFKQ